MKILLEGIKTLPNNLNGFYLDLGWNNLGDSMRYLWEGLK